MNEKIEKLLEQCHIETYGVNGELLEIGIDAEKFAELIVRECMDVCYRTDTEYEGHKVKSTVIASKVAEHFGVEE
jgi:hypothetical protein